jgi:biopolymer transport protein ExbD
MRVSSSLAEINVVPLVDVMLVLLVIFMVAAPMMHQGFQVQLPKSTRSQPLKDQPVTVTVPASFRTDRKVRIDDSVVAIDFLDERLRQALSGHLKRDVILASDGTVTYQDLALVMDKLSQAKVEGIGLKMQPVIEKAP